MRRIACTLVMSFFASLFSAASDGELVTPYSAPLVAALDQSGKSVSLADFYAQGTTLVYFYPKASTPGCTAQACSLRDAYEDLTKAGVRVVGVGCKKERYYCDSTGCYYCDGLGCRKATPPDHTLDSPEK